MPPARWPLIELSAGIVIPHPEVHMANQSPLERTDIFAKPIGINPIIYNQL